MGPISRAVTWLMNQVGYAICHQFAERSLSYGGRALPVCARDAGIFLGFAACFAALLIFYGRGPRRSPSWPKLAALSLFILPTVIDATTSYATMRQTTNAIRLVTGSLAGTGLAALVFPFAVSRLAPAVDPELREPAFASWWSVPALLAVPAAVSLLLLPDWPGAYWLWAPLVTLSILFTLLVLNFILVSLLLERAAGDARKAGPGALAALTALAVLVEVVLSNRLHWLVARFL
jgi:uncharacterized membrane protein